MLAATPQATPVRSNGAPNATLTHHRRQKINGEKQSQTWAMGLITESGRVAEASGKPEVQMN